MSHQMWWYLARASGIVAWVLLVASLVWGVLLATRVLKPHDRPAWLLDLHRWLGGLAMAMVGLHIGSLIGDSFVHFGVADVLVPFASSWKPAPVALGVLSFYVLAAVEVTSLAMRKLSRRAWRGVHLTSYGLVWLVSLHAGLAGTDVFNLAYRAVAALLLVAAMGATYVALLAPRRRGRATERRERVRALTATGPTRAA